MDPEQIARGRKSRRLMWSVAWLLFLLLMVAAAVEAAYDDDQTLTQTGSTFPSTLPVHEIRVIIETPGQAGDAAIVQVDDPAVLQAVSQETALERAAGDTGDTTVTNPVTIRIQLKLPLAADGMAD